MSDSPFLAIPTAAWVVSNDLAFAVRDGFPVSPGHTLVVPKRLVATWFEATPDEHRAIFELVERVKAQLDAELRPDGYNVGFNAGTAAGQTVMHLHVHVIPRFVGDMDDPRGGVRHVIPSRGNYLARPSPLASGGESDPFARHVLPLLARAQRVSIVAAFVQESGLVRIQAPLETALRQGAQVRLITGDYLNITQASALEMLLDWQSTWAEPDDEETDAPAGTFEARVIEVDRLPGRTRSFHPKSWHLEGNGFGVAFVGSSNLSLAALDTGIEWNLRVDRDRDRGAWTRVRDAIDEVWERARKLDADWVAAYAQRATERALALPPGELDTEFPTVPPEPHRVQDEALAALATAREQGRRRSLVVLATGLGKTWLAAFDYRQAWDELGRPPRLLFVAHRRELLRQAAQVFRCIARERGVALRVGWLLEEHGDVGAHLVFASVAKASRSPWLERLAKETFDYVVIDEVHHAAAESYRRILGVLDPAFLLGLTATPDRTDAADILGLFDDHVAYRADIARGISIGRLVPFRYFGLKDDVDYRADNIPWRNGRFDPAKLAAAVQTDARMETLWAAWGSHPASRSLVFCCSVAHADYTADWLASRGVRVARVYSAKGSDDRDDALKRLASGDLDAICAVDVFNEGVDVPALDRVVMLRPTESGVVFLQQLGRGLRAAADKAFLTVIDFVGNHRMFLERLRTLLSLGQEFAADALRRLVAEGEVDLPEGCSVEVTLEAKAELEALFKVGGADEVERAYRELRAARETRPSAGELYRMGFLPSTLRKRHGSWFAWVASEGDLSDAERAAVARSEGFLDELETGERMVKSYKMVTLEALIDANALTTGMPIDELALRSWQLLRRSPELLAEVPADERLPEEPEAAEQRRWVRYWRSNPINAWTSSKSRQRTWFRIVDDRLVLGLDVDAALVDLVRELVDYRLAMHRRRTPSTTSEGFSCRVTWNQRDPILKLPDRRQHALPDGEVDVRLPDGSVWLFRLAKEFCNVARPAGTPTNQLPDLLRRWFGPRAGQPGTAFEVRFVASPDGLWAEPVQGNVVALPVRRGIVAYPDLRAAAGHALGEVDVPEAGSVLLPFDGDAADLFAVRVAGTSMDGGKLPLRDGDWALMRLCRDAPADALANRVVLVQLPGHGSGSRYQIKRVVRADAGWRLVSDNPDGPTFEATDDMVAIARLDRALRPEDLAPAVGTRIATPELGDTFAIPGLTATSGRHGGHLFLVLGDGATLLAPDRVDARTPPAPGETAYVLVPTEDGVRYLGVGHWLVDEASWAIPEVAFEVWRQFGEGRAASRSLPAGALQRAQRVVDALVAFPEEQRVIVQGSGPRARLLGRAPKGGLRIAPGDTERTVSLVDLAWVAVAFDAVASNGGLLDEARVNRLRYLEGTPRGSTRWIDTRWALAAWALGGPLAAAAEVSASPYHPRRTDGTEVDATFRVEVLDGAPTIVIEARGGTRGTDQAQNTDYAEGLRLVLERLSAARLTLRDAALDTRETRDLPIEARRLDVRRAYPVRIDDAEALRLALGTAQERVGKAPGSKGGNATRRIRLWVGGVEQPTAAALVTLLRG